MLTKCYFLPNLKKTVQVGILGRNSPTLLTLVDLLSQKSVFTNITKLEGVAQNSTKVRDGSTLY
jgi:hypothetical protein